jgi:hypothetical protein
MRRMSGGKPAFLTLRFALVSSFMVVKHCQKPIRVKLGKLRIRKAGLSPLQVL